MDTLLPPAIPGFAAPAPVSPDAVLEVKALLRAAGWDEPAVEELSDIYTDLYRGMLPQGVCTCGAALSSASSSGTPTRRGNTPPSWARPCGSPTS